MNFRSYFPRIIEVAKDFSINIMDSLVYTIARQLILFPILAARLSPDEYGIVLYMTAFVSFCASLLGNTLNNVKLVQHPVYEENNITGDFPIICIIIFTFSAVLASGISIYLQLSLVTSVLLVLYTVCAVAREYFIVHYRLVLNFKKKFISNFIVSVIYISGALFFTDEIPWVITFLLGDFCGLVYTFIVCKCWKEPFTVTRLMKATCSKYLLFMASGIISSIVMYADRVVIYPSLGAESVSYYSVASFFAKSASMVLNPIAAVLLSYFSQRGFLASKKLFTLLNFTVLSILGLFSVACYIVAPWFTRIIYPTLFDGAVPYMMMANWGVIIYLAGSMAEPMILKFCDARWLVFIYIMYVIIYLGTAFWLMPNNGLLGFCYATIIANLIKLFLLYIIGYTKLNS